VALIQNPLFGAVKADFVLFKSAKANQKTKDIWLRKFPEHIVGEIVAYQMPGIALIRQQKQEHLSFATPLLINDPHSSLRVGMSLDFGFIEPIRPRRARARRGRNDELPTLKRTV